MMSHFDELKQKWEKFVHFLNEKGIIRTARITYNVTWNMFLIVAVLVILGGVFAAGVGAGFFASLVKDEPVRAYSAMKEDIYNYEETSTVYFDNDQYMGKLQSDLDRQEVKLEDVSPFVIKAIISTEDQYFYEHNGIVPKAIMRAMYEEFSGAQIVTGGSTLTQQLIKNQILTNEVSFDRKAKEILLAMRLEKVLKKNEILEAYLNIVPYGRNSSGRNVAGIQAASEGIFGVEASKLNLAQAAYIAGLPKNPFVYTPFTNGGEPKEDISAGLKRMKTVLSRMLSAGTITQAEYDEAIKYDVKKNLTTKKQSSFEKYPFLTVEVQRRTVEVLTKLEAEKDGKKVEELSPEELKEYKDNARTQIRQKGIKIHTTINQKIYDDMQQVVKNNNLFGPDNHYVYNSKGQRIKLEKPQPEEVGATLIDNKTGKIISFVGGRDFNREQTNHATRAPRQNGSTMKPLLAYSYAVETGKVQPGTIVPDTPININGWKPNNYDKGFDGLVSVRHSLKKSRNIPAIRSYQRVDHEKATEKLIQMGVTTLTKGDRTQPAMALGALDVGITVEENVNAFSTFANGGKFVDAYMIDRIETNDGEVIYQHKSEPKQVYSPQTSYLMIDMMRDVLASGTAAGVPRKLAFQSDWAGKTGTTNEDKDSWFVASNPNVTFGVWIGYDTPADLAGNTGQRNQTIWAQLINVAHKHAPQLIDPEQRFAMPSGIVRREICGISGKLPSDFCRSAGLVTTDLFNAKFTPKDVDDTLTKGRYVVVGDSKYKALPTTPEEFTKEGVLIKEEFLKELGLESLNKLTQKIDLLNNIVPEKVLKDNGKAPSPVAGTKMTNGVLTWSKHGENDVIGYRIYYSTDGKSFKKIGSVTSDKTSAKVPNGVVYVTAVDITGKESAAQTKVTVGEKKPPAKPGTPGTPPPPPGDGDKPDKPQDPPPPPTDPTDPGTGDPPPVTTQ
ncbi:transglycosylase domain-containing protein [Fictibacillus phosphorivorans]|uniref:transglycosylase domain-containing protein n=1 Tax=Fictibacillus phosphorivorans TaxID=1221500 RepID=UPI002041381D|nr:transglycosylase domain-containing protein [Fictibacillus phosphorivorans]MCM3717960.1 penicillin-binding protein [Fictibacillus phosphorivorans]MCM3775409.1 penicillin-binding protein [Fictibacillus phosphorivorans]